MVIETRGIKNPTPGAIGTKPPPAKKSQALKASTASNKMPTKTSGDALNDRTKVQPATKPPPAEVQPATKPPPAGIENPSMNFNQLIELAAKQTNQKYAQATTHSGKHNAKRLGLEAEFIKSIIGPQAHTLPKDLTKMVDSSCETPGKKVPVLFKALSGDVTLPKRRLLGQILLNYFESKKPQRTSKHKDLSPRTVMCYCRTLFAHMGDTQDWNYKLEKDFNFTGGLTAGLNTMFQNRKKACGNSYGAPKEAIISGTNSTKQIDWAVFDESDPVQHMQKVMVGFGAGFGFRGSDEHVTLSKNQIEKGTFEPGHPWAGEDYYAVINQVRKTSKLSTRTPVLKNNAAMRLPCKSKIGMCLTRYIDRIPPWRVRMYCKTATVGQKLCLTALGHTNAAFSARHPLGVNTICKLMKEACAKLGSPDATGHYFRRLFITSLANDPGICIEKSMQSAGHNSFFAQRPYIVRNAISKTAKFKALGIFKNTEEAEEAVNPNVP